MWNFSCLDLCLQHVPETAPIRKRAAFRDAGVMRLVIAASRRIFAEDGQLGLCKMLSEEANVARISIRIFCRGRVWNPPLSSALFFG
jgi:hypothetical protein